MSKDFSVNDEVSDSEFSLDAEISYSKDSDEWRRMKHF